MEHNYLTDEENEHGLPREVVRGSRYKKILELWQLWARQKLRKQSAWETMLEIRYHTALLAIQDAVILSLKEISDRSRK